MAATRLGLAATIVVPHGNSPEKNAAMRAFGAELVEHGHDFQAAYEHAAALPRTRGCICVPLVRSAAGARRRELCARAVRAPSTGLDTVYVPIGLGSGICGVIAARDALGLQRPRSSAWSPPNAPTYALSFAAGAPVADQ